MTTQDKKGRKLKQKKEFWTLSQQNTFVDEIQRNIKNYDCPTSRKSNKVFIKMSRRFKNKTSIQCRNHFKSIIKTFGDLNSYLTFFYSDRSNYFQQIKQKNSVKENNLQRNYQHQNQINQKGIFQQAQSNPLIVFPIRAYDSSDEDHLSGYSWIDKIFY